MKINQIQNPHSYLARTTMVDYEHRERVDCSNDADALQMHLGRKDNWGPHKIASKSLGYTRMRAGNVQGAKISQFEESRHYEKITIKEPLGKDLRDGNRMCIYVKRKDGKPINEYLDIYKNSTD